MSQFGAKNSPWGRAPGAPQQLNPNLFTGQVGLAHQFATMPQAAMQLGAAGLSGLVQQGGLPVNVAAFSQPAVTSMSMTLQHAAQQQAAAAVAGRAQSQAAVVAMQQQQQQQQQKNQRAFVGIVTKMQDNYGFVDDDVFFQVNVVRGVMPRIGDRVMVEANYNPNMPFKWNAFRIQLLPHQEQPQHVQQQLQQLQMQAPVQPQQQQQAPAPTTRQRESDRWGPPTNQHDAPASDYRSAASNRQRSPVRRRERSPPPVRDRRPTPPRRSPPPRRRSPSPRRHGSVVSSSSLKRERSPRGRSPTRERESDSRSPPRRRQRIIPRYVVQTPKVALDAKDASVLEVRKRYANMYVPTDFFNASFTWLSTLRLDKPILLENATEYHVMHKDVDPLVAIDAPLDPPDADHRFSAKVMLLATSSLADFYRKAFGLQDDGTLNEEVDPVAPSRLISFLVGLRGKNEVLAIGGPWSPSLDGADPQNDPRVLIRTAIRTTRALTGVDLSKCTQWYKFLELRYNRVDKERVDTVAIFVPDAWSAAPTKLEFEELQTQLRRQLDDKLVAIDSPPPAAAAAAAVAVEEPPKVAPMSSPSQQQVESGRCWPVESIDSSEEAEDAVEETTMDDDDAEEATEATHWTRLDVKALKVVELRQELEARGLDKRGVKNVLAARLQEAIDKEKANAQDTSAPSAAASIALAEASGSAETVSTETAAAVDASADTAQTVKPEAPAVDKKVDEKELQKQKEKEERERKEKKSSLERHYALPKEALPGILVFPHKTAKGGKFECKTMTLNALLDYRQDDNKEHSFEVAMFAEAFNEMLSRNCAFGIYKALLAAVDKDTEKKMKEEEKKKTDETDKPTENGDKAADSTEEAMDTSATESTDDKKDEKKTADKDKKAARAKEDAKNTIVLVKDPETLAAFAFFDTNLCGYLFERDAEEILHSLGLRLSRAQIQRLLKKVVTRDSLNYRKLTDVVVNKDTKEVKSAPYKVPLPPLGQIALGNNPLVADCSTSAGSDGVKRSGPPDVTDVPTVIYQGSLVDVAQNLSQLRRMESEQKAMEQRNAALEKDLKSAKETRELLEKKKRRLEDDVDKYKKRLHDAEKCLKNSQDDTVQLKTAMQECKKMGEKMVHLVDKVMPSLVKESKKSSSSPKKDTPKKVEATKSEEQPSSVDKEEENSMATNGEQETNMEELMVKDEISEEIDEEKAEVGGE